MLKRARHCAGWAVVAVVVGAFTIGAGGVGAASPGAHVAKRKTVNVTTSASLSLVKKKGNILLERGTATGTPLAGSVKARFNISNPAKTTGSVTFYPNGGGSLTVNVVGYPRSVGTVARFSGSLAVRKGTGRFSDATGSGTFTGTVNRRTWHVTVNARSRLTY